MLPQRKQGNVTPTKLGAWVLGTYKVLTVFRRTTKALNDKNHSAILSHKGGDWILSRPTLRLLMKVTAATLHGRMGTVGIPIYFIPRTLYPMASNVSLL